MRVLVCGGRNYSNEDHVFDVLDRLHRETPIEAVIHGACGWDADDPDMSRNPIMGADGLADIWARDREIKLYRVPAAWSRLGRSAGPTRNSGMLAYNPDLVVAFPGGRGTANMVAKARKAGVRVLPSSTPTETK